MSAKTIEQLGKHRGYKRPISDRRISEILAISMEEYYARYPKSRLYEDLRSALCRIEYSEKRLGQYVPA